MKNKVHLGLLIVLVMMQSIAIASDLPDPDLTPGMIDPTITQSNIHTTVCVKGYIQ